MHSSVQPGGIDPVTFLPSTFIIKSLPYRIPLAAADHDIDNFILIMIRIKLDHVHDVRIRIHMLVF